MNFYKLTFLPSCIISLGCAYLFYVHGLSAFFLLFWFKIATSTILNLYIKKAKEKEFYYYHNLGLSKGTLFGWAFVYDMILFFVILITISKLS